jgi:hypothetical protein
MYSLHCNPRTGRQPQFIALSPTYASADRHALPSVPRRPSYSKSGSPFSMHGPCTFFTAIYGLANMHSLYPSLLDSPRPRDNPFPAPCVGRARVNHQPSQAWAHVYSGSHPSLPDRPVYIPSATCCSAEQHAIPRLPGQPRYNKSQTVAQPMSVYTCTSDNLYPAH